MALGVSAVPFTYVVHLLGVVAIVLVLVWNLHFRGGLAWDSSNKAIIFNVRTLHFLFYYPSSLFALGLSYWRFSGSPSFWKIECYWVLTEFEIWPSNFVPICTLICSGERLSSNFPFPPFIMFLLLDVRLVLDD